MTAYFEEIDLSLDNIKQTLRRLESQMIESSIKLGDVLGKYYDKSQMDTNFIQ